MKILQHGLILTFLALLVAGCTTHKTPVAFTTQDYIERGFMFLSSDKYMDAYTQFNLALKRDPHNLEALLGKGRVLMAMGHAYSLSDPDRSVSTMIEAKKTFDLAHQKHKSNPLPLYMIGLLHYENYFSDFKRPQDEQYLTAHLEAAVVHFEKVYDRRKRLEDGGRLHYYLGRCYAAKAVNTANKELCWKAYEELLAFQAIGKISPEEENEASRVMLDIEDFVLDTWGQEEVQAFFDRRKGN